MVVSILLLILNCFALLVLISLDFLAMYRRSWLACLDVYALSSAKSRSPRELVSVHRIPLLPLLTLILLLSVLQLYLFTKIVYILFKIATLSMFLSPLSRQRTGQTGHVPSGLHKKGLHRSRHLCKL